MQPPSDLPPSDPVKKPKLLLPPNDDCPESPHHHHRGGGSPTATFHGLHHCLSSRPRAWLVVSILAIQLLLLLSVRSIPASSPAPRLGSRTSVAAPQNFNDSADVAVPPSLPVAATVTSSSSHAADEASADDEAACGYGRVYVYDLPPVFNMEFVDGCDDLNPWTSSCDALSNGGFGKPSADLAGVVPDALLPSWYATDQFAAELIYHRRMLADRCRTLDPSAAAAFYIPFYGGLAVGKYLWSENEKYTARDRDSHARMLLRWIRDREPWRKSQGRDHFVVLGRITWDFRRSGDGDWGGSFLYLPGMEKVTRLLIERNPWDDRDVGVPYPTGFHPRSSADLRGWQDFVLSGPRSTLFCFAGAPRSRIKNDFRGVLLDQCRKSPRGQCRSLDCSGTRCSNRTGETLGLFLDSAFCLQPRGDSFTRRSTFDCMVAGAIPVFFWQRSAYAQYEWFLPADGDEYSVLIDRAALRNGSVEVGKVLAGLGEERVRKMREKVVEMIPRLVYGQSGGVLGPGEEDAFDVAIEGVLRRFQEEKESGERSNEGYGEAAAGGGTEAGPVG